MVDDQADCDRARHWDRRSGLFSANLQHCDLSHADLEGAKLIGAQAQGASFRYATLAGANLKNADLRGCDLAHTNLDGCVLDYAQLQGANLLETSLHRASLKHANLTEATLWQTNFQQAQMNHVNLCQVHLQGCDLTEASLWRANLEQTFIKNSTFTGANLSEANARQCNFFDNVDMADSFLLGSDFHHAEGMVEREIRKARVSGDCILPDGSRLPAASTDDLVTLEEGKLLKPKPQQGHIKVLTQVAWVTASGGLDRTVEAGEYLDFSGETDVLISAAADADTTFLLW